MSFFLSVLFFSPLRLFGVQKGNATKNGKQKKVCVTSHIAETASLIKTYTERIRCVNTQLYIQLSFACNAITCIPMDG